MNEPLRRRKLLSAAVGVATVSYVAGCFDRSMADTSGGPAASAAPDAGGGSVSPGILPPPPTSGNLPAPPPPTSGNLPAPPGMVCGSTYCDVLTVPVLGEQQACCPQGDAVDVCGLDTSQLALYDFNLGAVCAEKNQPGVLSAQCPDRVISAPVFLYPNAGCCRPDGKCGIVIDGIDIPGFAVMELGLGCVDYTPLANTDAGEVNPSCSPAGADAGDSGSAASDAATD